jgi:hypothetical protein
LEVPIETLFLISRMSGAENRGYPKKNIFKKKCDRKTYDKSLDLGKVGPPS